MRRDPTLEQIAELMDELYAYHHRVVVIKIGGNSIAEDEHFLARVAKQVKFLRQNGVRVILIHGGGPQIDDALRQSKIESIKGTDGRRITSPAAMKIVLKVMNAMNKKVAKSILDEGCSRDKILMASESKRYFVQAQPLDPQDSDNRSGKPKSVVTTDITRALDASKIVILHSIGVGADGKTLYNINGDDYAMAVAIKIRAKRLIFVTNVAGVFDKERERIPAIDKPMAEELIQEGVITGGMIPKVESALWVVKQGVGGVAIIDGHRSWALLAELLTHEGFGTLFQSKIG